MSHKNFAPPNKLPSGLKFNFKPPQSMLQKLANNESTGPPSVSNDGPHNNHGNKNMEEVLTNIRPSEVAKRLNFSHWKELESLERKHEEVKKMEVEPVEEDEPIDLTHCIIPPEERLRLLKLDEEKKMKETMHTSSDLLESELKSMNLNAIPQVVRSKSPPRPRWPCLLDDYEYCLEERRELNALHEEKLRTHKMSGIAKVLCFEIPQLPVPEIEFQLLLPAPEHIKAFQFDTPSPDEIYLANLEKNKNKKKKPMFLMP